MFIVNKQYDDTYNTDHITNIYISSDGCTIKASAGTATRGGILGKYGSFKEAQTAFRMLMDGIGKNSPVYRMPSDGEVGEKIKAAPGDNYHHITGKKTKGHGAS
mgnify:FL=1